MRHLGIAVVMVMLAAVTPARASSFGGVTYAAPKGYTLEVAADHVTLRKVTGATFCSLTVFAVGLTLEAPEGAAARAWKDAVGDRFQRSGVRPVAPLKTRRGLAVRLTRATLDDGEGNTFASLHHAVLWPGMSASVLLTSTSAATLEKCRPAARALLDSLVLDPASMGPADPEARVETPVGTWGAGAPPPPPPAPLAPADPDAATLPAAAPPGRPAAPVLVLVPVSAQRQYAFAGDGTYRFHAELTGGKLSAGHVRVLDEAGTYTVVGFLLTLAPATASVVVRDETTSKATPKVALEKVTYTWQKLYDASTNTWSLVLVPPRATARDGELGTAPGLPTAYAYAERTVPTWTFPP